MNSVHSQTSLLFTQYERFACKQHVNVCRWDLVEVPGLCTVPNGTCMLYIHMNVMYSTCIAHVQHMYVIYTQSGMTAGLGHVEALSLLEAAQADM